MRLPVLLAVDDDRDALDDVETQLVQRYAHDYRIESLGDPEEALRTLQELADGGEDVALVLAVIVALVDIGRSPARARAPAAPARRARAARSGGRLVGSADRRRDPRLDGARDASTTTCPGRPGPSTRCSTRPSRASCSSGRGIGASFRRRFTSWARPGPGRAYELREVFEQCAAPHAFCLAESEQGRELLARAGPDAKLPLMVLPDGRALSDPSDAEIAELVGAPAALEERDFDVVDRRRRARGPLGGRLRRLRGAAHPRGGRRRHRRTGQVELADPQLPRLRHGRQRQPARRAGLRAGGRVRRELPVHASSDRARSLRATGSAVSLEDGRRVSARAVILATGATYRRLDVPSLEALRGAGVFYGGPVSEAPALKGKDAYIAGGGNSAGQAALHLARYARRVTLVVRASSLGAGMSHYLVQAVEATPNVEVRTGTAVVGGGGDGRLQQLVLRDSGGEEETVAADALFVLIGARPHIDWLPAEIAQRRARVPAHRAPIWTAHDWPLERRPLSLETSMPGVLAAGDVRHGSVKRVASAVGEGAIAVQLVHSLFADERPHLRTPAETASAGERSLDDGVLHRPQRGGGPRRHADLAVDVLDVVIGGLGRDVEPIGDLRAS